VNRDPLVGKIIDGRYELLARIGEGGMGVVYKARQVSIDRPIAIKMLNPEMAADPSWVQRFYNEAKACSRLQHPNTIRMFDFGQTGEGRLFMTMEYLEGSTLRRVIDQGPLAPQRVMKLLIQCCASLAEAHSIGIIHRDIKPDNVFVLNLAGSPDFVKLLDFSVAKLMQENNQVRTQAGVVFGTPQYMSPEQGRGMTLDPRSDLYALGILGYEMLTGRLPFHNENPMTVIQMHLNAQVPPMPPQVPASVQHLIRRALEKDPGRRFQSAGEMMQYCQHVYGELTQGGVSVGAAGGPRTLYAPAGPGQGMAPQQQGYPGAAHAQKTLVPEPLHRAALPGMPLTPGSPTRPDGSGVAYGGGPFSPGPVGYVTSSPIQKTIMAGAAPAARPPPAAVGGAQDEFAPGNKTVMLQPSDGIVSVAHGHLGIRHTGATPLFWVVSLLIGITSGALAYVIVRQF
jgi:serine/threonine-protein kinase